MIYFELLVVLLVIFIGARVGGIGLGIFGMIGLGILVFGFGLKPGDAPTDVMLIIVAVITAAAALHCTYRCNAYHCCSNHSSSSFALHLQM